MKVSKKYFECLHKGFKDFSFGDSRCLYDLSYFDWFGVNLSDIGCQSINELRENLDRIRPTWSQLIKDAAIDSVLSNTKPKDPFPSCMETPAWYLKENCMVLCYADEPARMYYLAAFMKEYLQNHDAFKNDPHNCTDIFLSYLEPPNFNDYFASHQLAWLNRISGLKAVLISRFLYYVSRNPDEYPDVKEVALHALNGFWRRHLREGLY